jgi:tetratricopeptide (TPR) repeat protein
MEQPTVDGQLEEALRLHTAGELDAAQEVYRRVLQQNPNDADALHLLGALLAQQGQAESGLELIDRAIAVDPTCADFLNNRGLILAALGRTDQAIAAHRQAIRLNPNFAEAHNNLGNALLQKGRIDEAAAMYRRTIALRPDYANAHSNLGVALHRLGKSDEAIAEYRAALKYQPQHAEAQSNLGVALREIGQIEKAIAAYRAAIAIDENCADAHANLGAALHDVGRPDQGIEALNRAIEINPRSASAHYNLALSLLQQGDYQRGFSEYEFRAYAVYSRQTFLTPPWDGRDLAGKTILLHAEGGFGDTILFARFVPMVKARGGMPILHVQAELVRLFAALDGAGAVIPKSQNPPPFEFHCPLLSLASVFNVTVPTIPAEKYLSADPALARHWAEKLGDDGRRRIGIAWAGTPLHCDDKYRNRSIPLETLAPIGTMPGIHLISLQKDRPAEKAPAGLELLDWTSALHDFADTAALIANLDLVISVDTAVANLAGAMGKKVFLLLPLVADWRWLRDRADSPWYPTMRIFRQQTAGDWGPVIAELIKSLP